MKTPIERTMAVQSNVRSGTWSLLIGLLAVVLAAHAVSYPLNHDAAWWLYIAGEMVRGRELYDALIEINPPLMGYVSMIPVLLSRVAHLRIEWVFEACVLGVGIIVIVASAILTADIRSRGFRYALVSAELLALVGAPGVDFGQREHLMLMLVTPYVLVVWRRVIGYRVSSRAAVLAGLAAAFGFCLKPHFVLIWLAIEGWWLFRVRPRDSATYRRPELWLVVGLGLGYIAYVIIRYPSYIRLVWEARQLYVDFGREPLLVLLSAPLVVPLGLATLTLTRGEDSVSELARIWLVVGVSAFAAMLFGGKGWTYHEYPVLASVIILAILLILAANNQRTDGATLVRYRVSVIGTCVAAILAAWSSSLIQVPQLQWKVQMLATRTPFFRQLPDETAVVMLTDLIEDAFPLVEITDVRWASPFPHMWWIRARYAGEAAVELPELRVMSDVERRLDEALVEQIEVDEPEFVFVDAGRSEVYGGEPFPYVAYLSRFVAFRELWGGYERAGSLDRFEIWRRKLPVDRTGS